MLRIDEALKIQFHHIEIGEKKIILTLPFRKTHQFGGELFLIIYPLPATEIYVSDVKPFVLHMLPEEEAYLCPVRAFADWISASRIASGYVFRRMAAGDRPVANNLPTVCSLPNSIEHHS
jgi:hypothetical protein